MAKITIEDITEVTHMVTRLNEKSAEDSQELFEAMTQWQPDLFSWLRGVMNEAKSPGEAINYHLIAIITLWRHYYKGELDT